MTITVYYHAIDGARNAKAFTSLEKAQEHAQYWVGRYPTIGRSHGYAISDDGVGKVTVEGCSILDLFPGAE